MTRLSTKSHQLILSPKTSLALCDRKNCPIFSRKQCQKCLFKISLQSETCSHMLSSILCYFGFLLDEHIATDNSQNHLPKIFQYRAYRHKLLIPRICERSADMRVLAAKILGDIYADSPTIVYYRKGELLVHKYYVFFQDSLSEVRQLILDSTPTREPAREKAK